MLTQEIRLKGNKVATQRLREKAIKSVGAEAIAKILEYRKQGMTLRSIADKLNSDGYKTMQGKEFQQAQIKRTLDRIKKNPYLIENVTDIIDTVTSQRDVDTVELTMLQMELENYKAKVEALYAENEQLRQTDIEVEILRNKLKEAMRPFLEIVENNVNPNQPRLKKMTELLEAIKKAIG